MVRSMQIFGAVCLWLLSVSGAAGQAVQLPSFQWFSVNTAVLAPDRGGADLAGVRRSSHGASRYGTPGVGKLPGLGRLLGNRALGSSAGETGVSVHVTVIDHEALDRAVLEQAKRQRNSRSNVSPQTVSPQVAELSQRLSSSARSAASESGDLQSVAEIRRQRAQRTEAQHQEALRLAAQGKQAAEKGSVGAARIFYQMAYRRADVALQQKIAQQLEQLK